MAVQHEQGIANHAPLLNLKVRLLGFAKMGVKAGRDRPGNDRGWTVGNSQAGKYLSQFKALETIGARDVKRVRAAAYADGRISRAEAERILAINEAATETCPQWADFFVESVTDYIVHQERPEGFISEDNADWLVAAISRDGTVETLTELELLATALEKARSSPDGLVAFALKQIADAVVDGKGPLAHVPGHLPNVVEKAEVDLLRRILYAFGGSGNIAITRAEAELLLSINDRTCEEMNHPSWNELFIKAMTNFVMCSSGYEAPTRAEALRRDDFFDRADADIGGFFARMISGVSGILEAYSSSAGIETEWEARNLFREAEARRAEAIDADEAQWLVERMGNDRLLRDNERAFLAFIRKSSPSIHPALKPLMDKVA